MTTTLQPRWLDADQQRIWRSFLNGVARINEHLEAELRPFGLEQRALFRGLAALPPTTVRRPLLRELRRALDAELHPSSPRFPQVGGKRRGEIGCLQIRVQP